MKYAVVAAALVGAAVADVYQWEPVKPTTTTTKKEVDPANTWEAVPSKDYDPEWEKDPKNPKNWKKTTTTAEWETVKATTTGKCSYVTEYPVTKYDKDNKEKYWVEKVKTTLYSDECTWADAEVVEVTKTKKVKEYETKCAYVTEVPVTKWDKDDKKKYWVEKTKTTYYTDVCTWADAEVVEVTETENVWEPVKTPVVVTETATWSDVPVVVTSVVKPEWTDKDGWFGPAWPKATDGCAVNVVTKYGAPVWKPSPAAPASTWSEAPVKPAEETTWASVAVKVQETSTWATVEVKETSTSATWAPVATGEVKGHAIYKPNGNKWAITYSPYTADSKCKGKDQIVIDVKKIKELGFTSIRIYGTQCEALKFIGDACREAGLKLILGVFIDKTGVEGAWSQVTEIKTWAQWDLVELIVIGNESVYSGYCKAEELVVFIKQCKDQFKAAGYTGSCTTTEPLDQWQKYGKQFCEVVDVVSANLYAFFNKDCPAENAGTFIKSQVDILTVICKDKETYVMESGWPKEGQCYGKACPSKENQAVAIKGIKEVTGAKVVFFSFEDELWKQPGQYGVEQHWGCADVFSNEWDPVKPKTTTSAVWDPVTVTSTTVKPTATGWS